MEVADAHAYVSRAYTGNVGRFYSSAEHLTIGKGLILREVPFALFDPEKSVHVTGIGIAYVLTHECDVDRENDRRLNDDLLVCPVIPLEDLLEELRLDLREDELRSFFAHLGQRNIPRLLYLPPVPDALPSGGVMFLNRITNAPVEHVKHLAVRVCALSAFGVQELEMALEHHLFRPKAERLAFEQ